MAEKALSDKAKIPLGFLVSLCETATSQIEDLRRGTAAAELISGSQGICRQQTAEIHPSMPASIVRHFPRELSRRVTGAVAL